jgi:prepilin-type N-terminal cleavage/methylation domain-containing protein
MQGFRLIDADRMRGFTLLELVAVLAIVAILSVSAITVLDVHSFDTARFTRELEATLAYAQKEAVARRRTVTVTISAGSADFTVCKDFPCGTTAPLPLPTQSGASSLAAPTGVTLSAATVTFVASGAATSTANPITVTGDSVQSVFVEGSGYVHR